MSTRTAELQILREDPRCPYCHEGVAIGQPQLACNQCRAWHHQGCWTEGGGKCSSCGAGATGLETPAVTPPAPLANPVWGDAVAQPYSEAKATAFLVAFALCTLLTGTVGVMAVISGVVVPAIAMGALSLFSAFATWAAWSTPGDNLERLRVPKRHHANPDALRAAIAERFTQSEGVFHKRGLSLHDPAGLELKHTLVLCMESAQEVLPLVPLLEPLAVSHTGTGTALVLAVREVSDEVLAVFRVNTARGVFPGVVLRADDAQLATLAEASGGRLVSAGAEPRAIDVGRVTGVSLSADAVAFADGPTIPLKTAE